MEVYSWENHPSMGHLYRGYVSHNQRAYHSIIISALFCISGSDVMYMEPIAAFSGLLLLVLSLTNREVLPSGHASCGPGPLKMGD